MPISSLFAFQTQIKLVGEVHGQDSSLFNVNLNREFSFHPQLSNFSNVMSKVVE